MEMSINCKFNMLQNVNIKALDTPGTIIKIEIQPGLYLYNVQYWLNGEQKYCWVQDSDLEDIA